MDKDWLVKVKRYDDSESIVARYEYWDDAQSRASKLNRDSQSKQYYVEAYDEAKADWN
jgi:hypothetical protein